MPEVSPFQISNYTTEPSYKNTQMEQLNRTEDPKTIPHSYTLDKGAKNTLKKRQPLQQMVLGKLDIHMQKTETTSPTFILYKTQFKMNQRP
jgi:hypothetical protein